MKKLLPILLILFSTSAMAGLSKWVDADGKVHYSDQPPPPNVRAKTIRIAPDAATSASLRDTTAASATAAPKTFAEREAELKKAQKAKIDAADKFAKEQARIEAGKANCSAAQQNLRTLQEGIPILEIDAKGERSYMSDEQRRQRTEKARQDIIIHCQ